jgi:hypothetical protein
LSDKTAPNLNKLCGFPKPLNGANIANTDPTILITPNSETGNNFMMRIDPRKAHILAIINDTKTKCPSFFKKFFRKSIKFFTKKII